MPYKIGGGFKLEAYDPDNGQYTEEDKISMRDIDDRRLKWPLTMGYEPHIPTLGVHSWEYAFKFVEKFKSYLYAENNPPKISDSKSHFLLDGIIKPERTRWLKEQGIYLPVSNSLDCHANQEYIKEFQKYLAKKTEFNTLYFFDYSEVDGCLLCNAITKINGYEVTTGWKIDRDFKLNFVTLIEGTERYYAKKNQIRQQGKVNI